MTNAARKLTTSPSEHSSDDTLSATDVRQVDDLESFINRAMTESGRQLDKIANRAFEVLVDSNADVALSGRSGFSPKYDVLVSRAGKTLQLDSGTLSRAIRVGALNHTLEDPRWSSLAWALKSELLPLLGADRDYDRLRKGISVASKPGTGRQALREWVSQERSKGAAPREQGALTPIKAGKLFEMAARLQRIAERRELADRVQRLDDDERKAWMSGLSLALRNLGKLQEEMTDTSGE
jgi:hypothetical protein